MTEIKAIETVYNGYRFRSRLEARWAVFFDAAGIKYEYEQEGYECDGERYLPDFYLPDLDVHAEVKADRPGVENDILRCMKMIQWGGAIKAIIFLGEVPPDSDGGHWHFPALYYRTGARKGGSVESGWWFFDTLYDENENPYTSGHITSMKYPAPFCYKRGKIYGMYKTETDENGCLNCFNEKPSTKPVSDRYLQKKDPPYFLTKSEWIEWQKNCIMGMNEQFYNALRKARQARFEHGECG